MSPQVFIERWVMSDLFALPLSRASKLKFLNDLHSHLPANSSRLHSARCENNPSCFWYTRLAAESLKVQMVRFAVDDTDADTLRVVTACQIRQRPKRRARRSARGSKKSWKTASGRSAELSSRALSCPCRRCGLLTRRSPQQKLGPVQDGHDGVPVWLPMNSDPSGFSRADKPRYFALRSMPSRTSAPGQILRCRRQQADPGQRGEREGC
jgi:hypothetical protein